MSPSAEPPSTGFGLPLSRQFVPGTSAPGARSVRKIFPPEEVAAFEREVLALQRAAGPGIPRLVGHGSDPESRQHFLEMEWAGDEDLRMRIARVGPLPAGEVLRLATRAAEILARLHAIPVVHGDVKPANVVCGADGNLWLVDLEHAAVDGGATGLATAFTGGTHGFAPPEAYLGAPPDAAFDLFGLGATLHFLLTGFLPPHLRSGDFDARLLSRLRPALPQALSNLMRALLERRPELRPSADQVLVEIANCHENGDGDLDRALLTGEPYDSARWRMAIALRQHWRRKLERLLASLPATPDETEPRQFVESALKFCRAMHLCQSFLPLLPKARERLARAQQRLPDRLRELPGEIQQLRQRMELQEARHLARLGVDLCRIVGVLHLSARDTPQLIEATGYALQSALRRLDHEDSRHRTILHRLEGTEAALDLAGAQSALAELLETFSGANRTAARVRDRHHRFVWLLGRLIGGSEGIEDAITMLPEPAEVDVLLETLRRVAAALDREPDHRHRSLSLLSRVFAELNDSHPKLDFGSAASQLTQLRLRLTNRAISLLDVMSSRLQVDPVPLRLLLRDLVEVDRILLLDCLVDSPDMPRTELIDRLEQLRLRIEEVSDQHRRIAAGAREQIEQGRLTTALYDLERALQAAASEDEEPSDGSAALHRELEMVRHLREEIRKATRRNLELAELHARLQDQRDSTLSERLKCLDQRESVLSFLLDRGPKAFHARYQMELREVRVARRHELATDAEERFLRESDPGRRAMIAERLLASLAGEPADPGEEAAGPHRALIRRWESYYERALDDAGARNAAERRARTRRHLRRAAIAILAIAGLAVGVFLLVRGG